MDDEDTIETVEAMASTLWLPWCADHFRLAVADKTIFGFWGDATSSSYSFQSKKNVSAQAMWQEFGFDDVGAEFSI